MKGNRFDLIGGTNGIPQVQVLKDLLGRTLKRGDRIVLKSNEIQSYVVTSVGPITDPRYPPGSQRLEVAAIIQMEFPPSTTGTTVITSAMIAERLPEEKAEGLAEGVERTYARITEGLEGGEGE